MMAVTSPSGRLMVLVSLVLVSQCLFVCFSWSFRYVTSISKDIASVGGDLHATAGWLLL
jgi:hypothetical protein